MNQNNARFWDTHSGRFVWLRKSPTPDFWDSHWEDTSIEDKARACADKVRLTERYIKPGPEQRVMDAGCGNGGLVLALSRSGYAACGVDFAPRAIQRAKASYPDLDVEHGDIKHLALPDEALDGYWSVGVIEHFWDGYDDILVEARRVLRPGGYAFVTFPWLSPIRRWKVRMGIIKRKAMNDEPQDFFQFCLDPESVKGHLKKLGFEITESRAQKGVLGFNQEIFDTQKKTITRLIGGAIRKLIRLWEYPFAHSYLIVARRGDCNA
jgi:SAM-dependent methyltransferase